MVIPMGLLHSAFANPTEWAVERSIPALEDRIQQTMIANDIPGMAVAIVSRDKILYLKTFGVKKRGSKDRITPRTLFQIASLSKPINATMLAILEEKGLLSMNDSINRYLPHFHVRNQQGALKIYHLLSHSSGIPSGGLNHLIEAKEPRNKIIHKLQNTRTVAPPGKRFIYNNAVYGVIEDIIVKVSGVTLAQALKSELFNPLGMHTASIGYESLLNAKDKAYPHVKNRRGKYVPISHYSKEYYKFSAAGGINASILDLVPFVQLYLGKPSPIISKDSLEKLTEPYVKNSKAIIVSEAQKGMIQNTYYGLGWHSMNYAHRKIIYHQGHLKGFRNFMGFLEDDVGIIILTNADKRHASKIALKFFNLYLNS